MTLKEKITKETSSLTFKTLRLGVIVTMLALLSHTTFGQSAAARPDRGAMPTGAYSVSDIEKVNLQNGNLSLSIPLAGLPPIAGGKLSWTLNAEYNSKMWDSVRSDQQPDPIDPATRYIQSDLQQSDMGGWLIGGVYSIRIHDSRDDYDWRTPADFNDPEYDLLTRNNWTKVVLTTPDGASHELRPYDFSPYPDGFNQHNYLRGYYKDNPNTVRTSMRYYSFDGSYLWVKIDPNGYFFTGAAQSWTLYLPDGTKVEQGSDGQRITDVNGNKIKIFGEQEGMLATTHYQDEQTGREIKCSYDPSGNNNRGLGLVQYQTVGGTWVTIKVNYDLTRVFGKRYEFGDPECPDAAHGVNTQFTVVRSIVYPQTEPGQPGKQFTFTYNSDATDTTNFQWHSLCSYAGYLTVTEASHGWGSLSQMQTPQGASVDYNYSLDGQHYLIFNPDAAPRESMFFKTVTHDGTADTWGYPISPTGGGVVSPDGSFIRETMYPYDGAYAHSYAGFGGKEGLVYRTNQSNKTMVERHWTLLNFGAENAAPGANVLVAFNPVVDAEYMSLLDDATHNPVKMSAKTFRYDFNGNLLQTIEYDWFDPALVSRDAQGVPLGVPPGATVLRTVNNSYHNQATLAGSPNVYAKRALSTTTPLLLSSLQQSTVGSSTTQLSYDNQPYGTAPTAGNLTSKSVWDDLDNKWITTSLSYDPYGNPATSTDARGKITQFFYDDASHAAPNRIVVDPQNGTGTQTTSTVYDYSSGMVLSRTDANSQTSTIDYTNQLLGAVDPFARPGVVIGPPLNINGTSQHQRTTTTYEDHLLRVTTASDLNAESDGLLKSRTTSDMLGRLVLSEASEDGNSYTIAARKAYDTTSRTTYSSNPMRPGSPAASDGWTRITSDTAGRVTEVATFGGATQPSTNPASSIPGWTGSVITAYDANFTTVSDQSGKQRRSKVDGLGRLIRVDEPDGNNNLGSIDNPAQPTSYTYDILGNLRKTIQGVQARTFTYDSLSRLRNAVNPESGSVNYTYDDNGNLTQKTDARNITTGYAYDALNRPITKSYSDGTPAVTFTYDSGTITNGKGRLASLSSSVATYNYSGYDALGRVAGGTQTLGAQSYSLGYDYDLAGHVRALTYPSGRIVNYSFDAAARLNNVTGNLGDGVTRTYATGITYDAAGRLKNEQFGTNTPVFNKLSYNSRGQLAEIRDSTAYAGRGDASWNRGEIINDYSAQCSGAGCNGSDNNGNLQKQENHIPDNDQVSSYQTYTDSFAYDSLNRLQTAAESRYVSATNQTTASWQQSNNYDRFGNRSINTNGNASWGNGINIVQTVVDATTNRLYAPNDPNHALVDYDAAGNQTKDYLTSNGTRVYDAENRIVSATDSGSNTSSYAYDANGGRVRRNVAGVETWQVYGIGGELLAEYAAKAAPSSPQKEYGYRNGQLLITAEPPTKTNFASSANGGTASASSILSNSYPASGVNNGDRRGANWGSGGGWADASSGSFPDWVEIDFNGSKTIDEIDVFTIQDNYTSPAEPTESMTFSIFGLSGYTVQYWDGAAWQTVSGGTIINNNKVWKKISFTALTTSKIKVVTNTAIDNGYSRMTEVEAWGNTAAPAPVNVASSANGATASASSILSSSFPAGGVNNGDRKGTNWGSGGGWASATTANFPNDWVEIDFNGSKTISEIDVFTIQDSYISPAEPTQTMTFSTFGLNGYTVQYWNGSAWQTVTGGTITSNNKVWKKISFAALTTSKIKVVTNSAIDNGYSRMTEVEAWGTGAPSGSSSAEIEWLVTDQLGTPRMVFDKTGSLAGMKRHDYLPFGEELSAGTGQRATSQGYTGNDGVRQQFTQKERDVETELDYFLARYYASKQGRFTSVDSSGGSIQPKNPQSLNRYTYALNNPLVYVDRNGKWPTWIHELIIDNALHGLSDAERRNIKEGSYFVDDPLNSGQSASQAYQHGMGIPGESTDDTAERADTFINDNVDAAQDYLKRNSPSWSLFRFGEAFHTVSDMTSPAHEGYQIWRARGVSLHRDTEKLISNFRMGLAVGATIYLYRYTYGPQALSRAVNYKPGSENDPSVLAIHRQSSLPGSDPHAEAEALYEYRLGLSEGLNFDWGRQRGRRGRRQSERPMAN
jgi:RHS repeat-associated protein